MKRNGFRSAIASGAVALALAGAPAMATTEYVGGGFLTDFSQACSPNWPAGGTVQVTTRVRPSGMPGNDQQRTTLNIFTGNLTMHFFWPEQNDWVWATATRFAAIGNTFTMNPTPMPRLRALPTPAGTTLSADGENAGHGIFQIENFAGIANCTVRLNVWVFRR